jgi:HSP20 family protein
MLKHESQHAAWLRRRRRYLAMVIRGWREMLMLATDPGKEHHMLRFDPFGDIDRLSREASRPARERREGMAFDAVKHQDTVYMYFDVPGVSGENISVTVEGNELTVTAERGWESAGQTVLAQERLQGTFTRRITLNDALDTTQMSADLDHGVLTVSVPMSEKIKPRSIQVKHSGGTEPIGTTGG